MQVRTKKLSLRAFLLLLACPVFACFFAFFVCYGRNIAWGILNLNQKRHAPLLAVNLNPAPLDEEFLQCSFLNLTLDVPASMARNTKIEKSSGARWLLFSDQSRKIRIPLSSHRAQRQAYGSVPTSISNLTNTELLSHIYKQGTSDFSLGLNKVQLDQHDWAMTCRDLFGYESQLENMTFISRENIQLLVLSVAPTASTRNTKKWLCFTSWSVADNSDGGMIYFFDAAAGDPDWALKSASSLRRPDKPAITSDEEFEKVIEGSTDDELLQMLDVSEPTSPVAGVAEQQ